MARRLVDSLGAWVARLTPGRRPSRLAKTLEWTARAGYAARGFVYLSVGIMAALASIELAHAATGTKGAVAALADWPLGEVWIIATACGLAAFAVWRALQSVFDADHHGNGLQGLASRAGQAVSGIVYGALAWSFLEIADGIEDIGEADENATAQQTAAEIMAFPLGHWIVMLIGVFVIGVGIANLVQAVRTDFGKRLGCDGSVHRFACAVGRLGYGARGVVFLPLGLTFLRAGWDLRASEARTLGGALQALEAQPFGSAILFLTGLGLAAFGVFAMIEARWRTIRPPDPV